MSERSKTIAFLTRKRRDLYKKGVNRKDIEDFFGVKNGVEFKNLPNTKLAKINNFVRANPVVITEFNRLNDKNFYRNNKFINRFNRQSEINYKRSRVSELAYLTNKELMLYDDKKFIKAKKSYQMMVKTMAEHVGWSERKLRYILDTVQDFEENEFIEFNDSGFGEVGFDGIGELYVLSKEDESYDLMDDVIVNRLNRIHERVKAMKRRINNRKSLRSTLNAVDKIKKTKKKTKKRKRK